MSVYFSGANILFLEFLSLLFLSVSKKGSRSRTTLQGSPHGLTPRALPPCALRCCPTCLALGCQAAEARGAHPHGLLDSSPSRVCKESNVLATRC